MPRVGLMIFYVCDAEATLKSQSHILDGSILYPFLIAALLIFDPGFPVERLPVLDWQQLGSLLLGMLGLG